MNQQSLEKCDPVMFIAANNDIIKSQNKLPLYLFSKLRWKVFYFAEISI